jgi:hypothetical protein
MKDKKNTMASFGINFSRNISCDTCKNLRAMVVFPLPPIPIITAILIFPF